MGAPHVKQQQECEEAAKHLSGIETKYVLSAISLALLPLLFLSLWGAGIDLGVWIDLLPDSLS